MNINAVNLDIDKNNFELLDKEKILSLSYDDKLKYMDELRIFYPKMNRILQKVDECFDSAVVSKRPLCMRISGPSGSGKTTIKEIHMKKHPTIKTPTGTEKTLLYSRIPCPAYIGGLASKLLHDLGDPFYAKSSKITLSTQRLYSLLRDCKVRIIFLDEVQHLVDRNSQKLLRDSSDWFKELIDETGIPIIFLGMPDSNKIFIENEQLSNRVRLVEEIMPFEYDDIFRKFLYLFDLSLPVKEMSEFANSDMSRRIFIATKGLVKNIKDLIVESTKLALQNNSNRISMPMLAKSYDKILRSELTSNPFLPGFNVNLLDY